MRKPFYRKTHSCWYVKNSQGRFVRLDPDERIAFEIWRRMLSGRFEDGPLATFNVLTAGFLKANERKREQQRFKATVRYILEFCDVHGNKAAQSLTEEDLTAWVLAPKSRVEKWSPRTQLDAINAVMAVLRWSLKKGKIANNPLSDLELPDSQPRSEIVSTDSHAKLMAGVHASLRRYLIASRCGARPRQIREVTASHVSPDGALWVFADHKTRKKTKRALVVYLPPCLRTLTKMLIQQNPDGPLFRNADGNPWKKDTVAQQIRRARRRLGLPESVVAYAYRHTFATQSLVAGASTAEVAELLGHKDTRMVSQVYGHLDKCQDHMKEVAARVFRK